MTDRAKERICAAGLLAVTLMWGGGFVASDRALDSFSPFQVLALRFGISLLFMLAVSGRKLFKIDKRSAAAGAVLGLLLFMGLGFQIVGLKYTTPSKNAFLTALNVVIVPIIAFVIKRRKVDARVLICSVLALAGAALMSLTSELTIGIGDTLTIICAVCFAAQIFATGEYASKYDATILNTMQMATSFVLSLAVMLIFDGAPDLAALSEGWPHAAYLGVISTGAALLIQTVCQKHVPETKAAITLSLESVFGAIFSAILLHEIMTPRMLVGSAVILAAVIISQLPGKTEKEKQTA